MIRLYLNENLTKHDKITLKNDNFHYLKNVMRVTINDEILLFNENDGEYNATIITITKSQIDLLINNLIIEASSEHLNDVELIFPPIKHNRLDFLIEKSTELGVRILSPIITNRTSVKNLNTERLFLIAKEAAEQCRRLSVPKIASPETFIKKLSSFDFKSRNLVFLDERKGNNNKTQLNKLKDKPISFIIGPEGGFSLDEFDILNSKGAISINLGPQILRTETAGIAILALYNLKDL